MKFHKGIALIALVVAVNVGVADVLRYKVVKNQGEDTPLHSLVRQHILVKGHISRSSLRETLLSIYRSRKTAHYRYFPGRPDVALYLYTDRDRLEAEEMGWVAMLIADRGGEPKISYNDTLIKLSGQSPQSRFGLKESVRKAISREMVACEDTGKATDACQVQVGRKHHISALIVGKIVEEAIQKNWPY